MNGGYVGKLLFVDLSKGSTQAEDLTESLARSFLGGYGLGARVLYDHMKADADPLGPDNILGFVTGPLTGTGAFFGSRFMTVHKSPVTGGWNDANSGGLFGTELKKAGYDAVFVSGVAEKPVCLWIEDGKAKIRDAQKLWGMDTVETVDALVAETGQKKLCASVIGPPGERLALMSCPINDAHRAPARGGVGAVMGSKKLKAIVASGSGTIPVADQERVKDLNRRVTAFLKSDSGPGPWKQYGTGLSTGISALSGDSPVKNWGGVGVTEFGKEAADKVACASFDERYKTRKYACAFCPVGCGGFYQHDGGKWPVGETRRPEYETVAAFGTLCLNSDVDSIIKANHICNRSGLDTISTGATIAWAIECFENGLFTKADTGGIELRWGDPDGIVAITQAMADGKGFGGVLANGSAYAAKYFGRGSQYLNVVMGVEIPMHDPKLAPGLGRTYMFDPTPGRHVKGGLGMGQIHNPDPSKYSPDGKGWRDILSTTRTEVVHSSGLCVFSNFSAPPGYVAEVIAAVTGWPFDAHEQFRTGLRILDMRQAFNLREGIRPSSIIAPPRVMGDPPQVAGPLMGAAVPHKGLGTEFFAAAAWDQETGRPSRTSLELLGGMDDVAAELYG